MPTADGHLDYKCTAMNLLVHATFHTSETAGYREIQTHTIEGSRREASGAGVPAGPVLPSSLGALGVREDPVAPAQHLEETMMGVLEVQVGPVKLSRQPGKGSLMTRTIRPLRTPARGPGMACMPLLQARVVIFIMQTRKLHST